jgi:hypothetical protein
MQATRSAPDSVLATLEEVSRLHAVRVDADAALFELAAVFADQHSGETLPRSGRVLPGTERAVWVGGVDTPQVAEFACAELSARPHDPDLDLYAARPGDRGRLRPRGLAGRHVWAVAGP